MDCNNQDDDLHYIICKHPELLIAFSVITCVMCWCLSSCICDRRSRGGGRYGSLP